MHQPGQTRRKTVSNGRSRAQAMSGGGRRTINKDVLGLDANLLHARDDFGVLAADFLGPEELLGLERWVDVDLEQRPSRDAAGGVGRRARSEIRRQVDDGDERTAGHRVDDVDLSR
jgi:hypothetical protein